MTDPVVIRHVKPADPYGKIRNPATDAYLPPEGEIVRRWTPYWQRLEQRGDEIIITVLPTDPAASSDEPAPSVDAPRTARTAPQPSPVRGLKDPASPKSGAGDKPADASDS